MPDIQIRKTSITRLDTDCIVNAANEGLRPGGGVCGAIFIEAGYVQLTAACEAIGHCETGSAVITPGFDLKANYIIHAVGPVWQGGLLDEAEKLYNCYRRSLELAMESGCHSIGFPLISAGIFGYPKEEAWEIALQACIDFDKENAEYEMKIVFAVLDDQILEMGQAELEWQLEAEADEGFEAEITQDELDLNAGAEAYQKGDFAAAVTFYRKAADAGNVIALSNLGYCYYYGRSIPVDKEKARECWEKAAILGDICAVYKLGDMYRNGDLKENTAYSKALYRRAYDMTSECADIYSYPDVYLRMLKYCSEDFDKDTLKEIARACVEGLEMRIAEGDRYSGKLLAEAKAIWNKIG